MTNNDADRSSRPRPAGAPPRAVREDGVVIYHLAERADWRPDGYAPPGLISEGFIHLSTATQLTATANRYYRGRIDLILVEVDEGRLTAPLRWEDRGDGVIFPHLYGPLTAAAVVAVRAVVPAPDGSFDLP